MDIETVTIDGEHMLNHRMVHEHLAEHLAFPDYYGHNLDALYDLLTERSSPTRLIVRHKRTLLSWLGDYGEALCQTLEDAARVNPRLEVLVQED